MVVYEKKMGWLPSASIFLVRGLYRESIFWFHKLNLSKRTYPSNYKTIEMKRVFSTQ